MTDKEELEELSGYYANQTWDWYKRQNNKLCQLGEDNVKYLLKFAYMDGRLAGEFNYSYDSDKIRKYLRFLEASGWSTLIDKRWKDDINASLGITFPDITEEELNHVDSIVLI